MVSAFSSIQENLQGLWQTDGGPLCNLNKLQTASLYASSPRSCGFEGPPGSEDIPSVCPDKKGVQLSSNVRWSDHGPSDPLSLLVEEPLQLPMFLNLIVQPKIWKSHQGMNIQQALSEIQVFQKRLLKEWQHMSESSLHASAWESGLPSAFGVVAKASIQVKVRRLFSRWQTFFLYTWERRKTLQSLQLRVIVQLVVCFLFHSYKSGNGQGCQVIIPKLQKRLTQGSSSHNSESHAGSPENYLPTLWALEAVFGLTSEPHGLSRKVKHLQGWTSRTFSHVLGLHGWREKRYCFV